MNEVAPGANGQLAKSEPSAFEALIHTGIISAEEVRAMPIGTRVMLHDGLRAFFWERALKMSASGGCPAHLKDDPETAFAVVRMALNWNMDYFSVAQSTYSPGGGKLGIEGKLAVGAMIGSRKVKSIKYEHGGKWDAIAGKFKMETSKFKDGNVRMKDGKPIMKAVATYTAEDELGLYVVATATMYDDSEVSTPEVYMNACHPRNSTLWAANPRRQIMYVADRMLFQIACADILMGVHFDVGLDEVPAEPVDIGGHSEVPKAVNLKEEGVKGGGETAPMTEAGVVHDGLDPRAPEILKGSQWTEEEQQRMKDSGSPPADFNRISPDTKKAKSAAMPETTEAPGTPNAGGVRRPRVKLMWQGKEIHQTGFVHDVKEQLAAVQTWEDLEHLQINVANALETVETTAGVKKISEQIDPLFEAVEKEFESDPEPETKHDPETGEIHDPNPAHTSQGSYEITGQSGVTTEELDLA